MIPAPHLTPDHLWRFAETARTDMVRVVRVLESVLTVRVGEPDKPTEEPTPPAAPRIDSPYLDIDEAAVYLKIAKRTIYKHRPEIPRQPGVRKLLFRREDLDAWIAKRPKKRR